ncbi:hypothetical protein AAG906_002103 [Vitis piasezkii]
MDIGLWYPMGDNFELIGYSDVDFASCKVERKSTSGTCHFLGHSLVSWHSKKQNLVALSTVEAEYIALGFNLIFVRLGLRVGVCSLLFDFILLLDSSFSFPFIRWLQDERHPSQPEQTEARQKARYDKDFGFEGLFGRMEWLPVVTIFEPIFPTLVRTFYSRVTYGLGGPVLSTVRGVEIRLSPEMYETKAWPTMTGFKPREAVQRLCGLEDAQGMGKPSAHSLTVPIQVLHHMNFSILLPQGGHRDEVSYLEAFIMDSILTKKRIHVGYLMMMHMISYVESTTRVLPYNCFLTRVFKDVGVNLSRETNFEAPTSYDTYDEQSLGRMKFEKALMAPRLIELSDRPE